MEPSTFQSLVESASDVIYRLDRTGRIQFVNEAVASILGYDPSELIGRSATSFVAPVSTNRIVSLYRRQILQASGSSYAEVPVLGKNGRLVWLGQHIHVVRDRGRVTALEVIARDISEHQRLAELQTGQRCLLELIARGKPLIEILDTLAYFLEAQVPNCSAALVVLDANGNLLRPLVAPGLADLSAQLIETVWEEKLPIPDALDAHPNDRLIVTDLRSDSLWNRVSVSETHFEYACSWTIPVLSKDRTATGILGLFHYDHLQPNEHDFRLLDVAAQLAGIAIERERMERNVRMELKRRVAERTLELEQKNRQLRQEIEDRLEAERALIRSQSLLKEAERIANLGSWSWMPGEKKHLWSDETFRIFGVSPADFEPSLRSIVLHIHPDDRRRVRELFLASAAGEERSGEFRIIRPDGEERVLEAEASLRNESHGVRLIGVVHDITEQRQLEKELLKAGERERKRVGRDLHDGLGQLLTGIGFLSKTLTQSLEEKQAEEAGDAAEITAHVENAIDHTRSLSKLLLPVELEVNGLEAALQRLRSHVENVYGITCKLKTTNYLPIPDAEIALHMYRVAQEAVNNAVRHGKPDTVAITLATSKGKTVLTVSDDGIGIPESVDRRGGGLGLRTMHYRAQTIGGSFSISRRRGGGTQVMCELPILVEESSDKIGTAGRPSVQEGTAGRRAVQDGTARRPSIRKIQPS